MKTLEKSEEKELYLNVKIVYITIWSQIRREIIHEEFDKLLSSV